MPCEDLRPESLIATVQKLRQQRSLHDSRRLLAHLRPHGLDTHPVLGNYLVPLLAECGSLVDAQHLFDRLPCRNQHSWTSLITAYIDHGFLQHAFPLYLRMQHEDLVPPNRVTCLALLGACARLQDAHAGRLIHTDIVRMGLDEDVVDGRALVGNTLVDVYAKCRSVAEARCVFDRLPVRDAFPWAALMSGYAEQGLNNEVLKCFAEMLLDGVQPDAFTYVCSLKASGSLGALETAQGLHNEVTQKAFETDLYVGSTMLDMYSKCGCCIEARHVFDELPFRSAVSWNALIRLYADNGLDDRVRDCFQCMELEGISPDSFTFVCILKSCGTSGTQGKGHEAHAEITKRGFEKELHVGSALVDMYTKCSAFAEARLVFDGLPVRDHVSWAAIIAGYTEHGFVDELLDYFEQMHLEGVYTDSVIFTCSMKACVSVGAVDTGQWVHAETIKRGLEREPSVSSALVSMYTKFGCVAEAFYEFDALPQRDILSWAALIEGLTEHRLYEEALNCSEAMKVEFVAPSAVTLVSSLKACGTIGALESGLRIHSEVIQMGLEGELYVGSAVVDMYTKCGLLAEARQVFDRLPIRDAVTCNALGAAYAEHGLDEEIGSILRQMKLDGVSADSITFVWCLKACALLGDVEKGQLVHSEVIKWGVEEDVHVANILVDTYNSCGWAAEAYQVFDRLSERDTVSYNTLITGYGQQGLVQEAANCFWQMQQEGLSPSPVTFLCSLKVCATRSALEPGQKIHVEIIKRGLEREVCLGSAIVDIYIKCGALVEAHQVFEELPNQDAVMWCALIAGYTEHGLADEARNSFEHMHMKGAYSDPVTLVCSLKACAAIRALDMGHGMHTEVLKRGFEADEYVGNTVVDMYCKCNSLAEAYHVFQRLPQEAVSWNVLIAGYSEHGLDEHVLTCLKQMQLDCVHIDAVTFVLCLKACGNLGALEMGHEIDAESRKKGLEREQSVGNILIEMYGKCGCVVEGWKVFNELPVRDVVSWTSMIKSYGENHEDFKAILCFEDMQQHGVKPNSVALTSVLAACSRASLVLKGHHYFKMMKQHAIEPTLDHCACMVDLFARSGQLYEAENFIAGMQCPPSNTILMALLSACKVYGEVEVGNRCFQQLVKMNPEESSAYLLMADIYSSAGRWEDANKVEQMRDLAEATKMPGTVSVEVNMMSHNFIAGDNPSPDISKMLILLSLGMKHEGYIPNPDPVVRHIANKREEPISFDFVDDFFLCSTDHFECIINGKPSLLCSNFDNEL